MPKNERQHQIYEQLGERGYTTVKELSRLLYTSESSIRRDLAAMERLGMVRRSYGGAELSSGRNPVIPFDTRSYDHAAQKRKIAEKTAALIKEGEVIFLDQSSTCYFLAQALTRFKSLTVVSNNLEILSLLSHTSLTVIASGGVVSKVNNNCLLGGGARRCFEEIYADWMFFSANALSSDGVITDCTAEEVELRRVMMKHAAKTVFLCDSTKLGRRAPYRQCDLSEIDMALSEDQALDGFMKIFPNLKTRL